MNPVGLTFTSRSAPVVARGGPFLPARAICTVTSRGAPDQFESQLGVPGPAHEQADIGEQEDRGGGKGGDCQQPESRAHLRRAQTPGDPHGSEPPVLRGHRP